MCIVCCYCVHERRKKTTESEPKDTPTKSRAEFYLFYSVFRSIVSYALCVCFFISLLCSSSCLYFRFVSLVGTSFFLSSYRSSYVVAVICNARKRIYVARTSSHRYKKECTHSSNRMLCMSDCRCCCFLCTICSTHAISMD